MKLSEKLIKLRKEKGLSQEEFGNEINVSRQAVSKWENGETKPDTDKIQEIVKKFDVSFEYLLNDEVESTEKEIKKQEIKKKLGASLKVLIIILIIYLLISVYKFIAFYRFYLIANSFSEENYMMNQDFDGTTKAQGYYGMNFFTKRVGNKIIKESSFHDSIEEKNKYSLPHDISFIDLENQKYYELNLDENTNNYTYKDVKNHVAPGENIEEIIENYKVNEVRETTLAYIPSGFKEILLASLNPAYYYVDIINRQFKSYHISNGLKMVVKLNNDFLIESVTAISEEEGAYLSSYYSYDYVQDHFKEIVEPVETYKDMIIYE